MQFSPLFVDWPSHCVARTETCKLTQPLSRETLECIEGHYCSITLEFLNFDERFWVSWHKNSLKGSDIASRTVIWHPDNQRIQTMTIDNPVFLPASFTPSERDVICAWARQNHRHGKWWDIVCCCCLLEKFSTTVARIGFHSICSSLLCCAFLHRW